jgi:hypothetical protein
MPLVDAILTSLIACGVSVGLLVIVTAVGAVRTSSDKSDR